MTKPRILIVDDEIAVAGELEGKLSGLGYEVAGIVASASEAFATMGHATPDLVMMDIVLGGSANGVEAAEELQRRWKIPVVFITASADDPALRRADSAEPFASVLKPFSDRDLRVNIELALCRSDAASGARDLDDRFFAVSIDLLCFLDFSGYFKRLNPAWERALGFTRAELMSRPFIEFVHPDDRERTLNQNREVRGGGQALTFENRYLCKDGSYRWLRWNAAPDPSDSVIYSVARDVTAEKQAQEEREQLVRDLRVALAEVQTLREILPICSYCRKIRDDENYWHTVENYVARHTKTRFSHGICPSCMAAEVEPQLEAFERKPEAR